MFIVDVIAWLFVLTGAVFAFTNHDAVISAPARLRRITKRKRTVKMTGDIEVESEDANWETHDS